MDLNKFFIIVSLFFNTISGTVSDKNTNEQLTGVIVVLNDKDTTYTDFDGNFFFNCEDSIKKIDFIYTSYSTDSIIFNKNIEKKDEMYCINQ